MAMNPLMNNRATLKGCLDVLKGDGDTLKADWETFKGDLFYALSGDVEALNATAMR